MKRSAIVLLSLLFTMDVLAQTPAGGAAPGSAASGAAIPAANTGATSTTAAVIGLGVAGFVAAAATYNTSPSH
jgi:hypothetical protein